MSRDELLQSLRRRLVDAAVDHSGLQAVLLVGRAEAYPEALCGDSDARDTMSWPMINRPSASPVARRIASFYRKQPHANQRIEVIAFFGEESELELFSRLAGSAMSLVSRFKVPEGYEAHEQHFAWVRWLFEQGPAADLEYHRVNWNKQKAGTTRRKKLASPFDPLTERPPPNQKYLEWSVCSSSSTNVFRLSLFVIDASLAAADNKTDNKKKTKNSTPENLDVARLAKDIKRKLGKPGFPTKVAVAVEFTNGDRPKALNLLRQVRRFPDLS